MPGRKYGRRFDPNETPPFLLRRPLPRTDAFMTRPKIVPGGLRKGSIEMRYLPSCDDRPVARRFAKRREVRGTRRLDNGGVPPNAWRRWLAGVCLRTQQMSLKTVGRPKSDGSVGVSSSRGENQTKSRLDVKVWE